MRICNAFYTVESVATDCGNNRFAKIRYQTREPIHKPLTGELVQVTTKEKQISTAIKPGKPQVLFGANIGKGLR
jgi:hypothetical protein